jgi:uncharacterized membrane protein YfcA
LDAATLIGMTLAIGGGALAKGATGMGLPLVAVPGLAAVVGIQQAIGIMLVPIVVTNAWQAWRFRAARRTPGLGFLRPFLAASTLGIALGTWALGALPDRGLGIVLGCVLLAYVAMRLLRPDLGLGARAAGRIAPPIGLVTGVLQGVTGAAGAIGVSYIHAMGLGRERHLFAVSVMFLGFAAVQIPAVILAGIYQPVWFLQGLWALLPVAAFMPLGGWLAARTGRTAFDRIVLAFLAAIGALLLLGL